MKYRRVRLGLLLCMWLTPYSILFAQSDSKLSCKESKEIETLIDSLARHLEGQKGSIIFFISVDVQGKKAYGCILKKMDSTITGEKLFIAEGELRKAYADGRLLSMNRGLIIDFFDDSKKYLTPALSEYDKREISHDNRMFLFAEINGQTVFKRQFCRSDYLSSKNQRMKLLFLKLGDIAD